MARKVIIYSTPYCGFCRAAKRIMDTRQVAYEEVLIESTSSPEFAALIAKSGMRTSPQIFVDDQLLGGYQELRALDAKDQLASLK